MKWKCLLPLLVLATFNTSASAALIPYFRMDSLAFLSSDIVLCDEVSYVEKRKANYAYQDATFTVVQVLKGACQPKEQLTVELDLVYTRRLTDAWMQPDTLPAIPMGRALLFLTKRKGIWRPAIGGVKLIIDGEAYTYGQFLSNPGPLWLAKVAPENFTILPITPYGEELLLKDLQLAQEKAKGLTAAIPGHASHDLIRTDYAPNTFLGLMVFGGAATALLLGVMYWQLVRSRRALHTPP